ncbi:hypothetical protein GWI33_005425 [Rhynchophorus ferrugineus]|uniref:Uncharacterized protein n=1 Tax=Rhynchophorus ferrugineus TaxID=354439 RepID=A0A834MG34_RHYFE|nr:hypothetical protein GWI33_005425 [Rhynchophorus ferrugineus]
MNRKAKFARKAGASAVSMNRGQISPARPVVYRLRRSAELFCTKTVYGWRSDDGGSSCLVQETPRCDRLHNDGGYNRSMVLLVLQLSKQDQ